MTLPVPHWGRFLVTESRSTGTDLKEMRNQRTWWFLVGLVSQGVQYIAAPDRALHSEAYRAIAGIGDTGWRIIGVLLIFAGLATKIEYTHQVAFVLAGLVIATLAVAQLYVGFAPSTLILPIGTCVLEVSQIGMLRRRDSSRRRTGS